MRILHLPVNVASSPSQTVRGLRLAGYDARGLVFANSVVQSAAGLKVVQTDAPRLSPPWLATKAATLYWFARTVAWADVLHWYYGAAALPAGLDLRIVRALRKPGIVEWVGSDIRVPEVEFADNPYYAAAYPHGYEYAASESLAGSRALQRRFADAGLIGAAPSSMHQYIQRDINPDPLVTPQRLVLSDYDPAYPVPDRRAPLIVHSPTARVAKGTAAVVAAIERLRARHQLEFRLIEGLPREEALRLIREADVFVDQFVLGAHGGATMEAMALGKPVVCYVKPALRRVYPPDLPVVDATQETLANALEPLLVDGVRRHELGRQGRAYMERHHDAVRVAPAIVALYEEAIRRWRNRPAVRDS